MAGIFNDPRFARSYVRDEEHGIPFLDSTDILRADLSFVPLLAKRQVQARPELVIEPSWTLISCSGTVGRMVFSRPDMSGMAGSANTDPERLDALDADLRALGYVWIPPGSTVMEAGIPSLMDFVRKKALAG